MSECEKVICYLGPTLPIQQAVELAPNVIYRPPANQSDILSDTVEIMPDRILLIDGNFEANFSVWHKEIVFALAREVKVYGASSMGALRAADLWRQGMVGYGKIFEWYKNGVTEDDSEVALLYSLDPKGLYHALSVPIVDIRATIRFFAKKLQIGIDHQEALLIAAKSVHFSRRTKERLTHIWNDILGEDIAKCLVNNLLNQKAEDAIGLLTSYKALQPAFEAQRPTDEALSKFFWAQYDRDRKIKVQTNDERPAVRIAQQHVSDYIGLSAIDHHQIFWDARNFYLSHMLAEKLGLQVSEPEVIQEHQRFCIRHGLRNEQEEIDWIGTNNLTQGEFIILIIRMCLVRKLHHWICSSLVPMNLTKLTLDYLKMHNSYTYWAKECAEKEAAIQARGGDAALLISTEAPVEAELAAHCQKSGLVVDGTLENFALETGFCSSQELSVAITRLSQVTE